MNLYIRLKKKLTIVMKILRVGYIGNRYYKLGLISLFFTRPRPCILKLTFAVPQFNKIGKWQSPSHMKNKHVL